MRIDSHYSYYKPWGRPDRPGRLDVNGDEWWACDPYPTWYRWEDGKLLLTPAKWADLELSAKHDNE